MSDEQAATPESNDATDLSGLDLELDAEAWETGGIEPAGAVGFKVESARIEKRKTKTGQPFAICTVECNIIARPGQKIEKPTKHFDDFSLNPRYIDRFKRFAAGLGVKPTPGQKVPLPEIVKALNGKTGFGVIKHTEFTHNGEKRKKAEFTKKFGKSFAEVQ